MREKLLKLKEKEKRKGVVYISRIPPKMKPRKLRSLLEPYGEIGRVYLAPQEEDPRKKAAKKSSGPQFSEGWVEFLDKTVAKDVAAMLNNQPMGGKKRSSHYSDLWSIKYLPKFKWDYLTEEAMYKRKVREQKMAIEISQAKRERDFYLQQVAQSKAVKAMEERRAKKRKAAEESGATGEGKESTQVPELCRPAAAVCTPWLRELPWASACSVPCARRRRPARRAPGKAPRGCARMGSGPRKGTGGDARRSLQGCCTCSRASKEEYRGLGCQNFVLPPSFLPNSISSVICPLRE